MRSFFLRMAACGLMGMVCLSCEAKGPRKADPRKMLAREIGGLLVDPEVSRDHWGIVVTAMDGASIYLLNEGQLFQPASNTKLYTTATAMALLGPETTFETRIVARGVFGGVQTLTGDLVLVGGGDANLSGREIPYVAPALRPKVEPGAAPLPEVNPLRYLEVEGGEWRCGGRRHAVSVGAVCAGLVDRRHGVGIRRAGVGIDDQR
jgi:hypothetical protein